MKGKDMNSQLLHEAPPALAVEFSDNPESRCPVVVLLDCSASMGGVPIDAVNKGLQQLRNDLAQDPLASKRVEISIIAFDDAVTVVQDFCTPDAMSPPILVANGNTAMGQGILKALDAIEERKAEYKAHGVNYYRPWCFMLTDGRPTDSIDEAARRVKSAEASKRVAFFSVAVDNADTEILAKISSRPPLKLMGLNFAALFEWLSNSLESVAVSQPGQEVTLPPVGWGTI
jgi:uncharacterized protein YegL